MKKATWEKQFLLAAGLFGFLWIKWEENALETTEFVYHHRKIPQSFWGYRILQLSDLHNKRFGKNQYYLMKMIQKAQPDCIVITGDLIYKRNPKTDAIEELIQRVVRQAPVYFVSGNHEKESGKYDQIRSLLKKYGVTILENKTLEIQKNKEKIILCGLADEKEVSLCRQTLKNMSKGQQKEFTILLAHRPERIKEYAHAGYDLAFCGHAHGGQVRIPLLGALVAPQQGLFPRYTKGLYRCGNMGMVVSRGLGRSIIKLRLFNRPELVLVHLGGCKKPDL